MRKQLVLWLFGLSLMVFSCQDEPKLSKEEETAVEDQINQDQQSMDSLEAAIMNQMDALNGDSMAMDSL